MAPGGGGSLHEGAKATGISFEPESNQRPKDVHTCRVYSPPLYQLSYRRVRAARPGPLTFTGNAGARHWDARGGTGPGLVGSPFEESGARAATPPGAGGRTGQSCGVAAAGPWWWPASGRRLSRCLGPRAHLWPPFPSPRPSPFYRWGPRRSAARTRGRGRGEGRWRSGCARGEGEAWQTRGEPTGRGTGEPAANRLATRCFRSAFSSK